MTLIIKSKKQAEQPDHLSTSNSFKIMSTSLESESERILELLNDESITSKKVRNNPIMKYWRFAFAASVLGFRAQQSGTKTMCPYSSYSALNIEAESGFGIKQTVLSQLVEEKDEVLLEELGGVDGIAVALRTDLVRGIHDEVEDIDRRRKAFGANILPNPPKKGFVQFLWPAMLDINVLILIICGSVSLGLGIELYRPKEGWKDGGSILIGVFFAIIVTATSDYWHNSVFEKLLKDSYNIQIDVVRSGSRQQILVPEIVVGDVVCLKHGDKIPAHGLVLEAHSLKLQVDKAIGKQDHSDHVELNLTNRNAFLLSGTKVVDGFASMLVTSVGVRARCDHMISRIGHNSRKLTPLQARLKKLDSVIDMVGYVFTFVVVILVTLLANFTGKDGLAKIYDTVNIVVGLIMSILNIPNPWWLSLLLTRAYAMKKLKAENAMVRQLSALETINFATTICVNKTGTITMNQMKVTKLWLGKDFVAQGAYLSNAPNVIKLLQEGIALNSITGCPTEEAVLSWAVQDLDMNTEEIKRSHDILHIEAFSSESKKSAILTKRKAHYEIYEVHLKGAAESVLAMCTHYYDASGIFKALDHNQKMKFEQVIQGMAASSLRCIAFAHKEVEAKEVQDVDKVEVPKDGMTLIGIVGISDPCRPGVTDAVKDLQNAGVNVKMITGDNIFAAKAIATECGILRPYSGEVIEGVKFRNYTPEERMKKVDEICVMASSSPSDKLLMVQCLKRKGHVVALAGSGTNNSLAMKEADIGVFMGIQGTEVTDESSDIVILDGNFASIPKVFMWGRCLYSSIQKFIQYQLTTSFAGLIANFVGLFLSQELTLTALQLLWVHLITETLACLAFATEKPTKELMKKPPVCKTEPLITNIMLRNILPQTLYQVALLLVIQIDGASIFSTDDDMLPVTFTFTSYVLCQVFNQVNARKLETKNVFEKIHRNKLFLVITAVIIILQILLVEILKMIGDTEKLNWPEWGICVGVAAFTLPIGWVARFIPIPDKQVVSYLMVVEVFGRLLLRKLTSMLTWASQVLYVMHRNQQLTAFLAITDRHRQCASLS
ncbi:P-type ATPase [Trema orientale]|uniref:Calcium-transporting ATPase n=1 Tax=Trema orientale TaxID=63057 RepID=A0A2P5FWB4_TREOI|nr:P-type ATPase [Trema orientale]